MPRAVKGPRPYKSERRQEQARQTRLSVLLAARKLFAHQGYGATTLQQIADEAEVSVQTVYASFGSKRVVLEQAIDVSIAGDDEQVAVNDRDWMHDVFNHPDPRVRLSSYAAAVRRIQAGAADMFAVVKAAAAVDPDLHALAATTEARRRTGARSVIDGLRSIDGLRADLPADEAVDVLWTLNSPEVFQLLVRRSGWSLDRYQAWLADTLQSQLLDPPKAATKTARRKPTR